MVVRGRKVAVFIDGDLWHGNPAEWQRRGRASLADLFPTRTSWWVEKIERNVARDRDVDRQLKERGWRVLRVWAHDVMTDPDSTADLVLTVLQERL
jgi:DNA mismatch endonuclease (patch repair protein)